MPRTLRVAMRLIVLPLRRAYVTTGTQSVRRRWYAPARHGRGNDGLADARTRILDAAYELFSSRGIRAVGIDAIIERSGVARMTLYRHFALEGRARPRLPGAARGAVDARAGCRPRSAAAPTTRPSACWRSSTCSTAGSGRGDFEGCSFINVLLEIEDAATTRCTRGRVALPGPHPRASSRAWRREAGIADPEGFARQWHILMKGSIVAAGEGDRRGRPRAQELGALLLAQHLPAATAG